MPREITVRTPADLRAAWDFVDGGHGYSAPQLFALLIAPDGRVEPQVIQVYDDDIDLADVDRMVLNLLSALGSLVWARRGSSVALMRARPGRATMTSDDELWCRTIHRHLVDTGLAAHPLYFATDDGFGPVPPDVLVAA